MAEASDLSPSDSPPPGDGDELRPEIDPETGMDISLILENLKLTPWERVQANDDAVNFCDAAAEALRKKYAASQSTPRTAG